MFLQSAIHFFDDGFHVSWAEVREDRLPGFTMMGWPVTGARAFRNIEGMISHYNPSILSSLGFPEEPQEALPWRDRTALWQATADYLRMDVRPAIALFCAHVDWNSCVHYHLIDSGIVRKVIRRTLYLAGDGQIQLAHVYKAWGATAMEEGLRVRTWKAV